MSATERKERVDEMLEAVGLDALTRRRYPHELSGGQLRRVALARILLLRPRVVILDEPTSGLDMSVQATVLKLLLQLREQFGHAREYRVIAPTHAVVAGAIITRQSDAILLRPVRQQVRNPLLDGRADEVIQWAVIAQAARAHELHRPRPANP